MDFTRQNSNSKYYIFNYKNNSNFNIGYPSDYRENQNKSAYSNYLNLNKSLSYYKCNEISNCSSCQINNFNNTMLIQNNSKDENCIVKVKLSSTRNKNNYDRNRRTFVIEYLNDEKNILNTDRYKHYCSFRNINRLNKRKNTFNNYKTSYSYNNIFNSQQVQTKNNNVDLNTLLDLNKGNNNMRNKLIDKQILDYLNRNNQEKKSLIKRMKCEYSNLNITDLNNYSYINNNNYYKNPNFYYNRSNNNESKNLNCFQSNNDKNKTNRIFKENGLNKKNTYSNYLKKRINKISDKKYPLKINFANENINSENIENSVPLINNINENSNNFISPRGITKKNYFNNYSIGRKKIPLPVMKNLSTKNIKMKNKKLNYTVNDTSSKKAFILDTNSTDRTISSNYTLNGSELVKKYKNKKSKIANSKNVIQKGFNLYYSNEKKTKENGNIIATKTKNFNILNNKKSKGKISLGKNETKKDEKKIKEIKKLKVIHKVINEQFNKTKDKGLKKDKNRESDNLRFSLQSMNDSKMMEMANNFIGDEELNKNEIKEILNSKKENNNKE